MNTKPHFIHTLEEVLREQLQIPMWGHPPAFPFDGVSKVLSKTLGADVKLNVGAREWKERDTLLAGLGKDVQTLSLELGPLTAPVFIAMPSADVRKLTQVLLQEDGEGLDDPDISAAYFDYALIQLLSELGPVHPFGNLNPMLASHAFDAQKAYCIDIALEHPEKTLWMRVICPEKFHTQFQTHFKGYPLDLKNLAASEATLIPLSIDIGSVELSASKWGEVQTGDFVILDRCTYSVRDKKGSLIMSSASKPLFQLRSKEGQVKILDYAYIFEEKTMEEEETTVPETELPHEEDAFHETEEELPPTHTEHQDLIAPDNVPLQITVEVGRLQMPLSKVLALAPGNVLDLKMRVEEGVTLCVSGKPIAKGELIQVGDVLGVKILDKG